MEPFDPINDPEIDEILTDQLPDFSSAFTTKQRFLTREDMINWARDVAKDNGFVIVILRSDSGNHGVKAIVVLGCERSGKFKPYNKPYKQLTTGTKKCDCPFRLKGRYGVKINGWKLNVVRGFHNHKVAESLIGHPYAGRFSQQETAFVSDMSKAGVKPSELMTALKNRFPSNLSSITGLYNLRQKLRKQERGPRKEFQHLLHELEKLNYGWWYRSHESDDIDGDPIVSDLFMAHEKSVQLLNTFPNVLLIDSTYKTNRYKMPLLEIVGVTSTNLSFNVAFALLEREKAENFIWALQRLQECLSLSKSSPEVIVTDRDLAMLKAVKNVFPHAKHLLCTYHIDKNVAAKCREFIRPVELIEDVMDIWHRIVNSTTEEEYVLHVTALENYPHPISVFVNYVKDTWLNPHKEMFVSAWRDAHMHLGNTTSNRVEGAHSKLKKVLKNSMCDLCACFEGIHKELTLQHVELIASFEQSTTLLEHRFNNKFYGQVNGVVSRAALDMIHKELQRSSKVGIDSSLCGCRLRLTHGLPCACKLSEYSMYHNCLPLWSIHIHWTKLYIEDTVVDGKQQKLSLEPEWEVMQKKFAGMNLTNQMIYKCRIREVACPETTSSVPPPVKVKPKGKKGEDMKKETSNKRDPSYWEHVNAFFDGASASPGAASSRTKPKNFLPYLDQFPPQIHPYIEDIIDVKADGNCGYRVVAKSVGMGEDGWPVVRNGLRKEIRYKQSLYLRLFETQERLDWLMDRIQGPSDPNEGVGQEKWMILPDIGYIIAMRYSTTVVTLSSRLMGCSTIFPIAFGMPPHGVRPKMICLGLVNGNHWVKVQLQDGCPLPPTDLLWRIRREANASIWEQAHYQRQLQWKNLFPEHDASHVNLDDD